jgi:hypothetical protein
MSPFRTELNLLRWPLLRLALALLLALVIGLFSLHFARESARQADTAELSATNIRNEALRLQSEEQDMRAKIAEYQSIEGRGIIGAEHRLDWVELMRSIQREHKLLGLEYEILPSQPLPGNPGGSGTGYIFMNSVVSIQIPMLHEEDLLHFLDDAHAGAAALTRLRSCKLQRSNTPPSTQGQGLPPQLMAECQMDWITLMPESMKK